MWLRPEIVVMITLGREKLMQHERIRYERVSTNEQHRNVKEASVVWPSKASFMSCDMIIVLRRRCFAMVSCMYETVLTNTPSLCQVVQKTASPYHNVEDLYSPE